MKKIIATLGTVLFIAGAVLVIFGCVCLIESAVFGKMVDNAESDMMSSFSEMWEFVDAA